MLVDFVRPVQAVIPGAQGRILAVLVETSAELNLRTLARLSGVSLAQASRVLPGLVSLGLVERREAPPSALFRVVPDHVAVRAVLALSRARDVILEEIGRGAAKLPGPPVSVIVFGSLARGDGGPESDVDLVLVRPAEVGEDSEDWRCAVEAWRTDVRRMAGSSVDLIEVGEGEIGRLLRSLRPMWKDVLRDGVVVHGAPLDELRRTTWRSRTKVGLVAQ
ncbi:MAG: nucleotidyltransferase domain-containing protein [Acidimicrobiia bacterium]